MAAVYNAPPAASSPVPPLALSLFHVVFEVVPRTSLKFFSSCRKSRNAVAETAEAPSPASKAVLSVKTRRLQLNDNLHARPRFADKYLKLGLGKPSSFFMIYLRDLFTRPSVKQFKFVIIFLVL